jgi:hypothetical protein
MGSHYYLAIYSMTKIPARHKKISCRDFKCSARAAVLADISSTLHHHFYADNYKCSSLYF